MQFLKLKRVWLGLFCLFILGLLSSCAGTRTLMMTAPSKPKGAAAHPIISANSVAEWERQKPLIQKLFEAQIYGAMPKSFETYKLKSENLVHHDYNATIELHKLRTTQEVDGSWEKVIGGKTVKAFSGNIDRIIEYDVVILTPKDINGPVPIIMMENFCPNHSVIPVEGIPKPEGNYFDCSGDGMMSNVFGYFFGRYITTPPIDMIMAHGYALGVIYPPATYPDNIEAFQLFSETGPSKEYPWGAVGAWAYQFSSLSNYLKTDTRFSKTISYGHSRYAKSALVAAAFDETIDGVIAHQSGTGGASLSRNKNGETVEAITKAYPHWFTPAYDEDTLTIDQHQLLALITPRPILLGNAKRDVWSDPEGAFRAAQGAASIYNLYGSDGLRQSKLTAFDPSADIAFWMRPGTHGVVKEDWPAFLKFMDAHFK